MALQVTITNINSVIYPVQVYVCRDCPNTDCTLVDTINSVPATITIPSPYDTYPLFGVKIIDSAGCEYCQTFQGTTTTTLNPICQSCDLGFDFYDTNPIGVISVGLITASCDPSVTDYVIEWYGPGIGSTTLAFTSGYGTDYIGDYLYDHPLTGSSQVPIVAGVYTPIVQKIKLNGTEYTDLNCFTSTNVNVDALTCINGAPTEVPQYSHKISFSAITNVTPQPVTTTFALDPIKPYFAFRFAGEQIYDTIKITLIGSSYSDPIVIEYLSHGVDLTETNFDLTLTPKKAKQNFVTPNAYFAKVLNLNNFTINTGDYLEIEITPNPLNNNTNWRFYCECLETFNCDICDESNITQPFKIIESTISVSTPTSCNLVNIDFDVSACTSSDIQRYMETSGSYADTAYNDGYYLPSSPYTLFYGSMSPDLITTCGCGGPAFPSICVPPSTSTITFNKSVVLGEGLITMTFTDYTDLEGYYNNWQSTYISYSGNPTDCNDIDFYRYFLFVVPLATGTQNCGDNTGYNSYYIHPSALVTSGGTGPWTMTITMPTISNCLSFTTCQLGCSDCINNSIINFINPSSTGITNNISITTNIGARLNQPITGITALSTFSSDNSIFTASNSITIPQYVNTLVPYSGSPLTLIPSLITETCDLSNWEYVSVSPPSKRLNYYLYYGYLYQVRCVNTLNPQDFEIWSPTFSNGAWVGFPAPPVYNKIYDYIGGIPTVYDPSYFI
jgi:hypothetical protein